MIALGFAAFWGFYGIGTWGWILVKGYNITFTDWFNPMKPYYWPGGTPGIVPAGSVFPTKSGNAAKTTAKVQVA
jgi:hypothetical protein